MYDKSVAQIIKDYVKTRPDQEIFTTSEILAHFQEKYPRLKPSGIKANLDMLSTNFRSRVHYRARPGSDDLFFRLEPGRFRRYVPERDPPPIHSEDQPRVDQTAAAGRVVESEEESGLPASELSNEFAYEHHLRDFLVRNLGMIEPGLRLYEEEGARGVEFPLRNRRVDILAVDGENGLVVIELKVSKGHDRVVGQLLTYMGWVRADIAEGRRVRGVVVAREISDEILTAIQESRADIAVHEYELTFRLRRIGGGGASPQ